MKNYQKYLIGLIGIVIVSLLVYGVYYAVKNNDEDTTVFDTDKSSIRAKEGMIDSVTQPTVNSKVTLDTLPDASNVINLIDYDDFKNLFKTSKKSILLLVKEGCNYCSIYEPILEKVLIKLNAKAYKIDIASLSDKDYIDMDNYINYDGTPTTYIIENGKVLHLLNGYAEEEIVEAFIDLFYLRG